MREELADLDATAQAALVRRGDVTPIELVDGAIARIERLNPRLNAVIHEHFERFLTQEHQRVGPWYYFIPFAIVGVLPWLLPLAAGLPRAWRAGERA